jgi:hypothetical protein
LRPAEESGPAVWAAADLGWWAEAVGRAELTGREVEDCLREMRREGFRRVLWSVHASGERGRELGGRRPLAAAVAFARRQGMTLYGRLGLNSIRGASHLFETHPEWRCVSRGGALDRTRLSLFFAGVRRERLDMLLAAARLGVDGLCLDFCDLPPMLRYHPELIRGYVFTGGPDPLALALTDEDFMDWCRYRAGFVTRLLRDLRDGLAPVEQERGSPLPVMARVPADGLELNLVAGMDLRTWARNGLVQALCLSPLHWLEGERSESLDPYLALAAETGVAALAGVSLMPPAGVTPNPMVLADRVAAAWNVGVTGLALDRAETGLRRRELAWILPALGEPERLTRLAGDQDRRRQYPVTDASRLFGIDALSVLPGGGTPQFPPADL